jgi:hypothetical protein
MVSLLNKYFDGTRGVWCPSSKKKLYIFFSIGGILDKFPLFIEAFLGLYGRDYCPPHIPAGFLRIPRTLQSPTAN